MRIFCDISNDSNATIYQKLRRPVPPNPEDELINVIENFGFTLDKRVGEEQQTEDCFVHEPGEDLNTDYIHLIVVDPDYSTQNSLSLEPHTRF